jgi:hypothetical protein
MSHINSRMAQEHVSLLHNWKYCHGQRAQLQKLVGDVYTFMRSAHGSGYRTMNMIV